MPWVDPWLVDGGWSPVEHERRLYNETRNPLHVWAAVRLCSDVIWHPPAAFTGYPDWVVEYLSQVADEITRLDVGGGDDLAHVLGIKRRGQGVRRDAVAEQGREHRDRALAQSVLQYLDEHPHASVRDACTQLAEDAAHEAAAWRQLGYEPPSEDTYYRAYRRWRAFEQTSTGTTT